MNFTAQRVPYQQTGYFSRIITDYLNGNDFLKNYYEHPVSFSGIEAAINQRERFPTDRSLLIKSLEAQYADVSYRGCGKEKSRKSFRQKYIYSYHSTSTGYIHR